MGFQDVIKDIEGYQEILKETEILCRHGIDYTAQKGSVEHLINTYHPKRIQLLIGRK